MKFSLMGRRSVARHLALGVALALGGGARSQADIYVVQIGTGAAALTNSSQATFIKQYSESGALVSTINMPTVAAGAQQPFTLSGTSTSLGFLKTSTDGNYLTLGGFAVAPGVADVSNTAATTARRAVARITVSTGVVDTTTVFTGDNTYSGNAIRSVVSDNGTNFWIGGTASGAGSSMNNGVRYATLGGTTSTQLNNTDPTNTRVVDIFGGQLYTSSASGASFGVSTVGAGLPTTSPQTLTLLPGFPTGGTHSSYDYWFKDASTLYVADDGSAVSAGGIQKWTLTDGTWSLAYTLLNNGATNTAVRGLTGKIVDGTAVLFGTTSGNSANLLISLTDTGAAATATTLATAPVNTAFRGLDLATPPPSTGIDADFDGDLDVDGNDFVIWQRNLGTGTTNAEGDSEGDSDVDATDLANWKLKFGLPVATAAGAAVPEPGSMAMVAVALCMAGAARRRR